MIPGKKVIWMAEKKSITRYSVWFFSFNGPPMWSIIGPFSFHRAVAFAEEYRRLYPLVKVVAVK